MIHSVTASGKFKKLVRRLRPLLDSNMISVETVATGLLERVWHIAIESARRGDIGRFDNELIAEMVGWHRDPDELIEILTSSGWLDESDEFRLVIHDWQDHCPKFIKKNIHRDGGFATSSAEQGLPSPEPESCSTEDSKQSKPSSREDQTTENNPQSSRYVSTPNITQLQTDRQTDRKPKFKFDSEKLGRFRDLPDIDPKIADKECTDSATVRIIGEWLKANPDYLPDRDVPAKALGGAILAFRSAGREKCRLRSYVASCLNSGVSDEWCSRFENLYESVSKKPP